MKVKLFFSKLFILLASITITMLLLEGIVRLLFGSSIVLFPRYHVARSIGEYMIRQNMPSVTFVHTSIDGRWTFRINRQGFRNEQDILMEKGDTLRILCLGDSHTLGYEVEQDQTYSAVLERYLHLRGYNVEAINAGVSGFSNAEALIFFEEEGIKYQPDIVILGFYANDLEDNVRSGLFVLNDEDQLEVKKKSYLPGVSFQQTIYRYPLMRWLHENSYLYAWLMNIAQDLYKKQLTEQARLEIEEFAISQRETHSTYELRLAQRIIEQMAYSANQHKIKFIIVDIPSSLGKGQFQSSVPIELKRIFTKVSDHYLDSEVYLEDYRGVTNIHVPHGHNHISPFTHAIIGVALGKEIERWYSRSEQ